MSINNNNALTLQLKRKVKMKRYPVIAKITFQRERAELVSLLKAMQQNSGNMAPRLTAYLYRENLWDKETNTLSEKGKVVQETGLYDAVERGLYHIWYTDKDPLLGVRPVLIQRDTAFFDPKTNVWMKGIDAARSDYNVDESMQVGVIEEVYDGRKTRQNKQELSLVRLDPEVVCLAEKQTNIELNWNMGLNQSLVSLKGQLDTFLFSQNKKTDVLESLEFEIDDFSGEFDSLMSSVADQFEGDWVGRDRCMAVKIDQIQGYPRALSNFTVGSRELEGLETSCGVFDSVKAKNISIKPVGQMDADQWYQNWLVDFYGKAYQSSEKARERQAQWLDHPALSEFELPLKDGFTLLGSLAREQQPEAFWHVAAMADLTPSKSKKFMMPITLVNAESLNLKGLINQLAGGTSVERIIYSDRYVHTSRQSRNLKIVAENIGDADGLLLTLGKQNGKEAELPCNWTRDIFTREHDNHGRFWILNGASGVYCWECTIGLDFIRETDSGFVVDGTPGFTPKELKELPRYLQEAVNEMMSLEVV